MSKKDNKLEANGENINTQRLSKTFSKTPDLLLTNSKNCQRSQNSRKNNVQPNLNVVRNKNVDVKTNEKDSNKKDNNRSKNSRGKDARQNNSRKVNQNLVQTVGFLSEGIGAAIQKKSEYTGGYSNEPMIQRPRLTNRDTKQNKEELEKEQKTLRHLLEENDLDDEDSKASSDDIVPIKIEHVTSSSVKTEYVRIKKEPVDFDAPLVKAESEDSSQNSVNGIKEEPGTVFKSEAFQTLFRHDPNQAVLFQLPDMLPQNLPDDEEEPMSKEGETEPIKAKPTKLSSLEHFSEGVIGKLIRYRSGKIKMMIGDYLYDVDNAISTDFQQHAVSISSNAQERSANMYSLGEISAKYNVIPDWNWLFDRVMKP